MCECRMLATAVCQASHLRLGPVAAALPAVSLFERLQSALPALSTRDTIPGHNDERLNHGNLLGESSLRYSLQSINGQCHPDSDRDHSVDEKPSSHNHTPRWRNRGFARERLVGPCWRNSEVPVFVCSSFALVSGLCTIRPFPSAPRWLRVRSVITLTTLVVATLTWQENDGRLLMPVTNLLIVVAKLACP